MATVDVTKAREFVNNAFEQARTPLLAALGAGDVATQAVIDAIARARTQVGDLPDVTELRDKLDPGELRKLVDQYSDAAVKLYQYLTEHGEETLTKLRSQPQVKRAVEQFDQAAQVAQQRAESAVEDARELADEVLGRVVRRTRSTGEKAARTVESVAEETAAKVEEAGGEAAHEVRSTTRKAANRTNSARRTTTAKPSDTDKSK